MDIPKNFIFFVRPSSINQDFLGPIEANIMGLVNQFFEGASKL